MFVLVSSSVSHLLGEFLAGKAGGDGNCCFRAALLLLFGTERESRNDVTTSLHWEGFNGL